MTKLWSVWQYVLAPLLQVSTTGQENIADHLRKAEPSVLTQSDPQSTSVTVQAAKYLNYQRNGNIYNSVSNASVCLFYGS